MTTLKDIAAHLQISNTAVSMALRDHPEISPQRRAQVKRLARDLGYRPNLSARTLRTRQSRSVGLLLPNLGTQSQNLKAEAMQRLLVARGYQMVLGRTHAEVDRSLRAIEEMQSRRVDALIVMDFLEDRRVHDALAAAGLPVVVVDVPSRRCGPGVCSVQIDRAAAYVKIVDHLLALGRSQIAFAAHDFSAPRSRAGVKLRSLHKAVNRRGGQLSFAPLNRSGWLALEATDAARSRGPTPHTSRWINHRRNERLAYRKGLEIARWTERPTALVMNNDLEAMAMVRGLLDAGLRVPEDVAVVGNDDLPPARFFRPSLTTLRHPVRALAHRVIELLLTKLDGGPIERPHISVTPRLIVRESAPSPSSAHRLR